MSDHAHAKMDVLSLWEQAQAGSLEAGQEFYHAFEHALRH